MLTMDRLAKYENENKIQNNFLENLSKIKKPAKIYLRNGICLQGYIEFFDEAVLILKDKERQVIYKSSIATILTIS